jgi:pimeloyl-ACP methyl ester carboxylesterase
MGGLISRILFQPPDPPSYGEEKHIIWLNSELDASEAKKLQKKLSKQNGSIGSSSSNDSRDITLESADISNSDQEFSSTTQYIKIPCVFLEYKGSDLCLLYSHGNATDMGQMMPYLELLRSSLKINVCAYEYQGYGISKPKVKSTENGIYNSIQAAVKFLVNDKKIPENKIIIYGTSLGTGPSVWIASQENAQFRGMVLQSPFTSVVKIRVPIKHVPFDMFENIERIDKVKCPVFIIHGKQDEVVPFEHAQALLKKIKTPYGPLFIDYAGHNNIIEILSVEKYLRQLLKFIMFLNEHYQKQEVE